jgi:hypothetical protein
VGSGGDLIERDRELDRLSRPVRAACSGPGALTLLTGPPGIGTTRLVSEAADTPPMLAVGDGQRSDAQSVRFLKCLTVRLDHFPPVVGTTCAGGIQRERAGGYAAS